MDIVHVLIESGGQYEDHWENPIFVSTNLDLVEARKLERSSRVKALAVLQGLYQEQREQWSKQNPGPTIDTPYQEPIPKWTNIRTQDITLAMREEREAIKQRNHERFRIAYIPWEEHMTRRGEQLEKIRNEVGITEKELDQDTNLRWHIKQVEFGG